MELIRAYERSLWTLCTLTNHMAWGHMSLIVGRKGLVNQGAAGAGGIIRANKVGESD